MAVSKKYNSLTDDEMVALYKASKDNKYVGELYTKYTHLVYGVCYKYLKDQELSKDACMQIFEKLLVDLLTHEISNFKSWLYSVAKNYCLMQLRASKGNIHVPLPDHENGFMEYGDHLHLKDQVDLEVDLTKLESGINRLNIEQRTCVDLFYLQEKSYKEICSQTGFSLNDVKSFIQNGKRNLKIFMSDHKTNIVKMIFLMVGLKFFF